MADEVETILESRAAAAFDRYAERRAIIGIAEEGGDARGGPVAELDSGSGRLFNGYGHG